jgi:GNAT superfamily N-acetyltransferase
MAYYRHRGDVIVRELHPREFFEVEAGIWSQYHGQTADRKTDRIFGGFLGDTLAGVARVRRHPDGREVDGVFVLEEYRGRGIARKIMELLLEETGDQVLWMHSVLELVPFYASLGWRPVGEEVLPPTIRARLVFCMGEMEGCGVAPMVRRP